jgi:hypothetical protein
VGQVVADQLVARKRSLVAVSFGRADNGRRIVVVPEHLFARDAVTRRFNTDMLALALSTRDFQRRNRMRSTLPQWLRENRKVPNADMLAREILSRRGYSGTFCRKQGGRTLRVVSAIPAAPRENDVVHRSNRNRS